jgi:hypothetical protein
MFVNTDQYSEFFSDSSKRVAVHLIREFDESFTLKKAPEELRLPLVFRSISDRFSKGWLLKKFGQLQSYDFKKAFHQVTLGQDPVVRN